MPLATPTLTVTDNADGTGGVATVAGSDPAATNTVYVLNVDGQIGNGTWVSAGSRVGDGTVSIAMAVGYYFVKCESSLGGETVLSNLPYIAFTDGQEAVHKRCLDAVKAGIELLALPGLTADRIYRRWVPVDRRLVLEANNKDVKFPFVMVCPTGTEVEDVTLNVTDDVGYPVLVGLVDNLNQGLEDDMATLLLWRQMLLRAFRHKRLAGVTEINLVTVEPKPIVEIDQYLANLFVSGFVVRCKARKGRI